MDRLFTLNGKTYKAAEFDLNLMCDFEDIGISIDDLGKKNINFIRQYIASSMGVDAKTAGKEITEHVTNGGKLEDITDVLNAAIEESGFFRTASESKDPATTTRTTKKKSESAEVTS